MAGHQQGPRVGYAQLASYWESSQLSARVHILTSSIGYVLRKWPVISMGPRVVYWQPIFGYHQGCRTVLMGVGYLLLRKWSVISKGLRVVYSQPTFGALGYLVEMVGLFWVGYYVRGKWGAHVRKEWVLNYEQVWKFTRVHSTHPLHHLKRSSTLNRAHWRSYTTWGCKSIAAASAAAAAFSSMCISWAQGTGGPEARSH